MGFAEIEVYFKIKMFYNEKIEKRTKEGYCMDLSMLTGPAIGAVIGYFTNYLAVKMLFRPLHPVKIGGYTLPFTPGVIPKGQKRLAKALGNVVGTTLLTEEDIKNTLLSDKMLDSLNQAVEEIYESKEKNIKSYFLSYTDEETYEDGKEVLGRKATELVMREVEKLPIAQWIVEKGTDAVVSNLDGLLAMMISGDMVRSLVTPAGKKMEEYIKEEGENILRPILQEKIDALEEKTPGEVMEKAGLELEILKKAVRKIYEGFINDKISDLMKKINFNQMVEDKINQMPVEEMEELVLSVMKKELSTVVNLGAVIGFVIGILNVFI